jgi:dienelactone hydrolase
VIRLRTAAALAVAAAIVVVGVPSSVGGIPAASALKELQQAVGAYRFADGTVAAVFVQLPGSSLRFVDYGSGALRELAQVSHNRFVGGPGVRVLRPVRLRIDLVRVQGQIVGLRRRGRYASRIPLTAEPASFSNGDSRFAGRLLLPAGAGPFPAVVLVPGSVPATRDTYDLWALFFASQGFAVLSYDKRGVGESTGRYVEEASTDNLHNLAGDAVAGVTWLRTRANIDPERIGLSGGSQAGFTIPLAAARSSEVAFATIQSGPVTSVGRQLAYGAVTGTGARVPPPTTEEIRAALTQVPDEGFDPRPVLAALHIPVLWQLGGVDKRASTPESVANLAPITAAGTHEFTVRVYPAGAHSLRRTRHGLISEELRSPGFVQGLFADLAAWLDAHVSRTSG